MIWFLVVPAVWTVISLLLGVLIGQCIRIGRSDAPDAAPANAAATSASTGPLPREDEGRVAADDNPVPAGALAAAFSVSDAGSRVAVCHGALAMAP